MTTVIFPGQGSQKVGMGKFYYEHFPFARSLFEEASDELKINFKRLCFEGPESELTFTENAQPATVLVSCAAWFSLSKEMDTSPVKYCTGHSVGEYSALIVAGVLPFNEGLKIVKRRAQLMNRACPSGQGGGGMMALIGPSTEEAKQFCKWVEQTTSPFEPANFNTPEQTVLSGSGKAIKWALENYNHYQGFTKSPRLIPLKVSGPFHSSLMKPAAEQMKPVLENVSFQTPKLLVVQNATAQFEQETENIKYNLIKQIPSPVLWYPSINHLLKQGCTHFLELGEGKVLSGLMKKINKSVQTSQFHSIDDIQTLKKKL